jgi:23S rRNA maturation-related 3'-5' exoribonuclease YhaM
LEFNKHCLNILDEDFFDHKGNVDINQDNITHNILSHHGQRAYGSPVFPATREAWVLHLADNLSARLDDCDKHDRIKS